jgi:hypothetical protein
MGIRRTRECIVTPMVRLLDGRTLYIRLMVAGSEMADQEMNSTAPASTACQAGTTITRANPARATRLKIRSDFLVPMRSARYPPGNA